MKERPADLMPAPIQMRREVPGAVPSHFLGEVAASSAKGFRFVIHFYFGDREASIPYASEEEYPTIEHTKKALENHLRHAVGAML